MSDRDLDKKTTKEEMDKMMEKFLANGGKVEKLKPGMAQGAGSLDRSKQPHYTKHEIETGKDAKYGEYKPDELKVYKPNTYHDFDVGGNDLPGIASKKNEGGNDT